MHKKLHEHEPGDFPHGNSDGRGMKHQILIGRARIMWECYTWVEHRVKWENKEVRHGRMKGNNEKKMEVSEEKGEWIVVNLHHNMENVHIISDWDVE